jgi:predicted Zn-dependent protease with MMP-like domain
MTRPEFEQLVAEGLKQIPEKFLKELNNVSIVIEDFPNEYQRRKLRLRGHQSLFGLYEGLPLSKRQASHYSGVLPDKITIFQQVIEYFARTPEAVKAMVADTVWHEIGHHFGMSETEVRAAEMRRKQ